MMDWTPFTSTIPAIVTAALAYPLIRERFGVLTEQNALVKTQLADAHTRIKQLEVELHTEEAAHQQAKKRTAELEDKLRFTPDNDGLLRDPNDRAYCPCCKSLLWAVSHDIYECVQHGVIDRSCNRSNQIHFESDRRNPHNHSST